jgi:hypothetical protein
MANSGMRDVEKGAGPDHCRIARQLADDSCSGHGAQVRDSTTGNAPGTTDELLPIV